MTAINFPPSPSNGDTHVVGDVTYTYDSTETKWKTTVTSNAFLPLSGGTIGGNLVLGGELQHDGDTDTKIYFDTDTIKLDTGGSTRATVDSSGRLLVGTSTAGATLNTVFQGHSSSSTSEAIVCLSRSSVSASGDSIGQLRFTTSNAANDFAWIEAEVDGTPGASDYPGRLVFSTTADGASSPTERIRIASDGNVRLGYFDGNIGTSENTNSGFTLSNQNFSIARSSIYAKAYFSQIGNVSGEMIRFSRNGADVGSIDVAGSSTLYNTSTDYRLKENVVPLTGAVDRLNQLQVRRFNFIADPDTTVDGFLAHEAQAVVPEAVTGTHDEVDDDGNPVYQGIDQSKLVPLLTAALQEALAKIETLETRLTALEGGAN